MPRDPADFPGNPNPPAPKIEAPKQAPAAPASESSAGTGALPPEAQPQSQAGSAPLAEPASKSYSVSDKGVFALSDTDFEKVGDVALSKDDADKILKASGATYDKERGAWENVPENVTKTLTTAKPTFLKELGQQFGAGEAELHRGALYDAALRGEMSFADAQARSAPDLVQVQLAERPGMAWHGLGEAVGRFMEHPLEETEDVLKESVLKTAKALPSILDVVKGAAKVSGGAGVAVGLAAPPLAIPAASVGAAVGTFGSLYHMETGGLAADMAERGFQEKTIREVAPIAGAVKAAMWMYGVDAMAAPLKNVFLKGLAESSVAQKIITSWAARYALNAGIKMPALGAAQSAVADLTNNLAALADKRPDLMRTAKDFSKNAVHAAIDMGQISAVAGLPGAAMEGLDAAHETKLAAEMDEKLKTFERREPAPSLQGQSSPGASPSGESTLSPAPQTASGEPPLETPRAPLGSPEPQAADLKSPLSESIKDHPAFVKASEEARDFLPEGVKPDDREGVINAYAKAAQDAHDYKNTAMVQLGKDEIGKAALTADEKNQISAQMHENVMRMMALRQLALFARDPENAAAFEDWKAGGQEGAKPPVPVDPYTEQISAKVAGPAAPLPEEQKLEEALGDKNAEPAKVVKAAGAAAERLAEKQQEATVGARGQQVKSDLEALRQRIGEIASTRDRMQKNGLSTRAIDRQLNSLVDKAVSTQKELDVIGKRDPSELEVSPRAKLQMKPATLQNIMEAGFKEGGKQSQERARELLKLAEDNGLTASDVKKLIGNKAIGAMGDSAYHNFLEGFDRAAEEGKEPVHTPGFKEGVKALVERKGARAEVARVLQEKQLEKEQYIRQINGLPAFSKMTTEQLKSYADILRQYDKGDEALSPKRIEALKGTMLSDVKTMGEAREKVAQLTGRPVEDFENVRVPLKARAIPDPQLRQWFPALRPFVDLAGEMSEKGERLAEIVRERNEALAAEAIRERHATAGAGTRAADWFAPQQREVMAYLEAKDPNESMTRAEALTPAELKWAGFLKAWFGTAEDYLVKKEGLTSRFSGNYAPHVNRGWPEIFRDLKEQGVLKSLKEFLPQAQTKNADFVDAQGNVLGFNKFFKQSIFRTGALEPSKNVVEAANHYISDFYRKASLDQIAPVLDTLARAMKAEPDEKIGFDPKESAPMTSSLQDFVKAYVNNKKGINNSAGAVGEFLAPALRLSENLAALHYIAGNYALQIIKGSVAIPASEFMALGTDFFKAKALKFTDQGKAILEKYQSFTGKSPWEEISRPGADARDFARAITYGGFSMAHKAAMEDLLLGSMTKDEFAKGEISDARLNEIRQQAGRWMDLSRSDSIMGSSAPGKAFTQYKGWAIPPTLTLAEDARALAKQVMGKGKMTDVQVHEVMRLAAMGGVAATAGTFISKDMEDDSFRGQAIHYLRRALGSVWRGLDPAFFFSAAGPGYVAKLAADLHLLGTLERDKNDELKGVKALKRDLTPRLAKDIGKAIGD